MHTQRQPAPRQRVPTRAIAVTIGMVLATAAILLLDRSGTPSVSRWVRLA